MHTNNTKRDGFEICDFFWLRGECKAGEYQALYRKRVERVKEKTRKRKHSNERRGLYAVRTPCILASFCLCAFYPAILCHSGTAATKTQHHLKDEDTEETAQYTRKYRFRIRFGLSGFRIFNPIHSVHTVRVKEREKERTNEKFTPKIHRSNVLDVRLCVRALSATAFTT